MTAQAASTTTLSDTDFAVAIGDRCFEDCAPGAVYEYGHIVVTAEEIVEFAQRFGPQPIHTGPGFAASGLFGGLIASGWRTKAELINQDDQIVLHLTAMNILGRRGAGGN